MSLLGYLLLFGTAFPNAFAAPSSVPDVVSAWVPASLKGVQQDIYDFLNPFNTPSVTQAIVSSVVLIFVSAITTSSIAIRFPNNITRFQALCLRIRHTVYGLVAPDYFAIGYWIKRLAEGSSPLVYNRLYNKDAPRQFKWTALHGAFVMHGGLVLREDDKPDRVLYFRNISPLIESGEIELPPLSEQDILARSTRAPGYIAIWFFILPIYWFIWKFTLVLPALTLLATMHSLLSWYAYVWRSRTIIAVVEPIILFRRSREMKVLISGVKVNDVEKGILQASDDSEKGVVASVAEALDSADLSEKPMNPSDNVPAAPTKALPSSLTPKFVYHVLRKTSSHVSQVFRAITSPMMIQWQTISKSKNMRTRLIFCIAGILVAFPSWTIYYSTSRKIPFPSEAERHIWYISSLFLTLQPFIMLLAPQRVTSKIRKSVKKLIWIIYNLAYAVARISIFFIVVHSTKLAV